MTVPFAAHLSSTYAVRLWAKGGQSEEEILILRRVGHFLCYFVAFASERVARMQMLWEKFFVSIRFELYWILSQVSTRFNVMRLPWNIAMWHSNDIPGLEAS